jgi:hypothetical protein
MQKARQPPVAAFDFPGIAAREGGDLAVSFARRDVWWYVDRLLSHGKNCGDMSGLGEGVKKN